MQSFNVDPKYDHILKELSGFLDLESCEIVDKFDRLWVKTYFKNFDFEARFSLNFNTVDFRLYFPGDPELAFNQNYKVWSEENMLQIAEYYYHRAKQRRYMHEFIDDLLIDVRKEFQDEFYANRYEKKKKDQTKIKILIHKDLRMLNDDHGVHDSIVDISFLSVNDQVHKARIRSIVFISKSLQYDHIRNL